MAKIQRALISVSDKSGINEFARELSALGVELISTGGTARSIKESGVAVIPIDEVTGFPEMMDGRVKTLHPKIHAGLLALRDNPEHMDQLSEHGIKPIDMVVVNLYPFEKTVANPDVGMDSAIENIDIGGPTMLRSAAKNFRSVATVVDPSDYPAVIDELKQNGGRLSQPTLERLMVKVFEHTASYDAAIHRYFFRELDQPGFPARVNLAFAKKQELRYGENPFQKAAFYAGPPTGYPCISNAEKLHGKELSFNNILDCNAALEMALEFEEPTAVVIKHTNPTGIACADHILDAYIKARDVDSVSAFGSVTAFNRVVTQRTAREIATSFVEAVIAPDFTEKAMAVLAEKKDIRLLKVPALGAPKPAEWDMKWVRGGLLVQELDEALIDEDKLEVVSETKPTEAQMRDLMIGWKAVKHVKSNAIVLASGGQTIGTGAGQMSRVDSMRIAIDKAGDKARGAVAASDAFFPFRDNIDEAARAGIKAIIEPGGSLRDDEVIQACNEHGIALVFTGMRHFKH